MAAVRPSRPLRDRRRLTARPERSHLTRQTHPAPLALCPPAQRAAPQPGPPTFASAHSSSCWCAAPSSHSDAMHCWILSSLLPHFLSTERISPSLIPLGNRGFHCSGGGDGRPRRGHEVSEGCGKQHVARVIGATERAPFWRGRQYERRRVQLVASSKTSRRGASVPFAPPLAEREELLPGARARRGAMAPEPKGTPPGARLAGHRRVRRTTTARGPRSSIRTS